MKNRKIVIFGGSGFIGQHLISKLISKGHRISVVVRSEKSAKKLASLPIDIAIIDYADDYKLEACLKGQDVAINLVGILHETAVNSFRVIHEELPLKILRKCSVETVTQFIHMSALPANAKIGPSRYLYSRGRGEDGILAEETEVSVVTIRPSVVFGSGDHFFSSFCGLLKWMPVLPLACPYARFAPVFVGDVVDAILALLAEPKHFSGKQIDLCGPKTYTLRELIEFLAQAAARKRIIFGLPDPIARTQGLILGLLPGKIFTLDNYRSLQVDSVSRQNGIDLLRITPKSVEEIMEPLIKEYN